MDILAPSTNGKGATIMLIEYGQQTIIIGSCLSRSSCRDRAGWTQYNDGWW